MAISEAARKNHDELFPNHVSTLAVTDPELVEYFDNFAFDEVLRYGDLDTKTRLMVQLAALIACQTLNEYRVMLGAALTIGVTPWGFPWKPLDHRRFGLQVPDAGGGVELGAGGRRRSRRNVATPIAIAAKMVRNFFMDFLLVLAHSLSVTTGAHPGEAALFAGLARQAQARSQKARSAAR